jgi:murein DD-endopeptidase MepM/ murein hydrolase activator NlpD
MTSVVPTPVGTVPNLVGVRLRADVELDPGRTLDWYEIELGPRAGADDPRWNRPMWQFRSDMPDLQALGGEAAYDGMEVVSAQPRLRFRVSDAITAYRWQLRQDGKVVARGRVRDGIDPAERRFVIETPEKLRRTDQPAPTRPDVLYPPFETHFPPSADPRPGTRVRYRASTGTNHAANGNNFAVDFNFRSGGDDRRHFVVAIAKGRVVQVVENNGEVHIVHPGFGDGGRFESWYAHMQPVLVKEGDEVEPLQRIGRIGSKYHDPTKTISPHLHHQHRVDDRGERMRFFMKGRMRPVEVSQGQPTLFEEWSQRVTAWDRPRGLAAGRYAVRVRRASDGVWSPTNRLRFIVAARGDEVEPPDVEPVGDPPVAPSFAHRYGGRERDPGEYSLRYRVRDDAGVTSDWVFDHSVVVRPEFHD